jgi:hypothetical protein
MAFRRAMDGSSIRPVGQAEMSVNDQQEAFEKLLGSNLARVFDLVRFAETKNAALLTFASAWILAMLNLLSSDRTLPAGFAPAFLAALPLFAMAAVVCVVSFLPKIDISRRDPAARHGETGQHRNLLFFLDIAALPLPAYEAAARARYWPDPGNAASEAYLSDLAREVAVNSRIVARKFRLFNLGARIVCCAIAILLAPAIWHVAGWIAR